MENAENKCQQPPRFYYTLMCIYLVCGLLFVGISIDMRCARTERDREVQQLRAQVEAQLVRVQAIRDRLVLLKEMGIIPDNIEELIREWEEMKENQQSTINH